MDTQNWGHSEWRSRIKEKLEWKRTYQEATNKGKDS